MGLVHRRLDFVTGEMTHELDDVGTGFELLTNSFPPTLGPGGFDDGAVSRVERAQPFGTVPAGTGNCLSGRKNTRPMRRRSRTHRFN